MEEYRNRISELEEVKSKYDSLRKNETFTDEQLQEEYER